MDTLVDALEEIGEAIRDRYVERFFALREAAGERPYHHQEASDEELAKRILPAWYVYGNAHPDVAKNYWRERMADPNREVLRHKDTLKLQKTAQRLYRDPRFVAYPLLYADDQQKQELMQMLAQGLHAGRTYPTGDDDEP